MRFPRVEALRSHQRVHPDNVHLTAITMPFGLFELLVMPMGFRNMLGIQQQRVMSALQKYIGVFCHVYLDDILIWSENVNDHITHC